MNDERQHYCVGFALEEDFSRVALLMKDHPERQAGKLNGCGGKVEEGETPVQAMVREFKEELGTDSEESDWYNFATLETTHWKLECFSTLLPQPKWDRLKAMESEDLVRTRIRSMTTNGFRYVDFVQMLVHKACLAEFDRSHTPEKYVNITFRTPG
jgi:8-oxo-dGTP pyrophosphatase MutT (NUDIX family)